MRNACGFRSETVAAEYETDAALAEWPFSTFPPADHYFWAAWKAELALREKDFEWVSAGGRRAR